MRNLSCILFFSLILLNCSSTQIIKNKSSAKKEQIFKNVNEISANNIDSVKIYVLTRYAMDGYAKGFHSYKLSHQEIEILVAELKDKTNYYGGTPVAFEFTSVIEFYYENKVNRLNIAPETNKVFQEDFKITHNKLKKITALGNATYFPFIEDEFALFLKQLEEKIK